MAATFTGFLWGVSVESRDGTPADCLDAAIDHLMQIWDAKAAAAA